MSGDASEKTDPRLSGNSPWVVAIGASGSEGLSDIKALLSALPTGLPLIVLVVLHRPWRAITHLREVLSRSSKLPVVIASDGESFRAGVVYIGEPSAHLTVIAQGYARIVEDSERLYANRTIDVLFHSLAAIVDKRFAGVVLSGGSNDGSQGLAAIHKAGGKTMVIASQNPGFPGMPENAVSYDGPIDFIGTAKKLAAAITALVAP